MNIPTNLKYTKSDEWVLVDGNTAKIGITDFAQNSLSDLVYVEFLVEPDDVIKASTAIATLESVKAAADVSSPLAGTVLEVNEALPDAPETINSAPYDAWMVKIEIADASGLKDLLDAAGYEKYCQERGH